MQWMAEGTTDFLGSLDRLSDDALSAATALPGWTGRQLVAHVAANAAALTNLAHWAATGLVTPMYASPEQRAEDIEAGALRPPPELRQWVARTADELAAALADLSETQWTQQVRTAQGRLVPASEVPWMRAREVLVHAVDLDPECSFADLPEPFLLALIDDIVARRTTIADHPGLILTVAGGQTWTVAGDGAATKVEGSTAEVATFLAGRSGVTATTATGVLPPIPPWL
jgi:maleylpyruvate isomerase